MVPIVMDYYLSFVRALDPNVYRNNESSHWAQWNVASSGSTGASDGVVRRRIVMELGNITMEDVPADEVSRCDFWESLARITDQRLKGFNLEAHSSEMVIN
jgi:hypothetical protein